MTLGILMSLNHWFQWDENHLEIEGKAKNGTSGALFDLG